MPNELNCIALHDSDDLKYNADGSLDIYMQLNRGVILARNLQFLDKIPSEG